MTPHQQRRILSVQQLNRRARQILEQLPLVWVEGELSNVSVPASGHLYFSLKDAQAQIRCALFRQKSLALNFRPQVGQRVVVRGQLSLFEGRGDYQLIIEHMELAGSGALQQQLEMLKQKLHAEGLFDPQRKQAVPKHPLHIGVVTSPSGAAIRDVLTVLQRRFPSIPVTIIPTSVQGQMAPAEIVHAIQLAEMSGLFDVLLITRGGGSLEDLWAFNDEQVVRAIAVCPIPTVSAVGHETDVSLSDWAADIRAATPSAGAELLSPDRVTLAKHLQDYERQLLSGLTLKLEQAKQKLLNLTTRLRHPRDDLRQKSQVLDMLELRLKAAIQSQLQAQRLKYTQLNHGLTQSNPSHSLEKLRQRLSICSDRLPNATQQQVERQKQALQTLVQRLNSVSPLAVLERGYSIAYLESEAGDELESDNSHEAKTPQNLQASHIVTSANALKKGDKLRVQLSEGEALCQVEKLTVPQS